MHFLGGIQLLTLGVIGAYLAKALRSNRSSDRAITSKPSPGVGYSRERAFRFKSVPGSGAKSSPLSWWSGAAYTWLLFAGTTWSN